MRMKKDDRLNAFQNVGLEKLSWAGK